MLRVQVEHGEHLVLEHSDVEPEEVLDRARRMHGDPAPNAMRQHCPGTLQHFLGTRGTILPIAVTNEQRVGHRNLDRSL